jgi:hypothetical protein
MSNEASDSIAAAPGAFNRVGDAVEPDPVPEAQSKRAPRRRRWWRRRKTDLWDDVGSLTVIVPVSRQPERLATLRATLAKVDEAIRNGPRPPQTPQSKDPKTRSPLCEMKHLHVARWVVLPERVRGRGARMQPSLLMWTVFDGTRAAHLRELVGGARDMLDEIYADCDDYPGPRGSARAVERFLARHESSGRVAPYVGTPGVSVETVHKQQRLVEKELVPFVRNLRKQGLPNHHVFLATQDFIHCRTAQQIEDPELRTFAQRRPGTRTPPNLYLDLFWNLLRSRNTLLAVIVFGAAVFGLGEWWHIGTGLAGALAFVGIAALGLAAALLTVFGFGLRNAEKREAERYIEASDRELRDHDNSVGRKDNEGAGMNRVTIITDLKPGLVRQITLRFVVWLVAFRAGRNFEGVLQGIETIHFAQWRIVDRGRRLLFISNYDGQADAYFREFAENSAPGVNAIWGNTEGMPNTTALIGEGSRNLEEFENAARVHQIPTDAWYCGYEDRRFLTAAINDNWRIHRLLHQHPTPDQVDEWMTLLARYGV